MSDYEDLTDCPICPQLATDRDDALAEAEALRAEVDEYARMYAEVAKVYDHVTGGMISKPETDAVHVIAEADNQVMQRISDAIREDREATP